MGKPSIIIPFMSEQEANGRLFAEAHKAGFVLRKTTPATSGRHFEFDLRYSGPSPTGEITADEVRRGLEELFSDPAYQQGAHAISTRIQRLVRGRSFLKLVESAAGQEVSS
jgi:UDP:flavonoid glycosyltransferase YjiC (YdhE family)